MATIQDVATRASVSIATVSHVLNNTRFVSEETRAAVLEAIRELNYHPSAAARSLSSRKTRTIGMVISDVSNVFFGQMIQGVLDVITPEDYNLILCTTSESLAKEEEYFQLLLGRAVDGLIAAAISERWATLQTAEARKIPVVFVDRTFEGMEGPYIGVDNVRGAYEAICHLIDDGHRRIGVVAGLAHMSTMRERVEGYRRALQERGIGYDESLVVYSSLSIEGGKEAALQLLDRADRPEALFSNNNLLTLGVLLALQERGLVCPDRVALACFDDHPWAGVASSPLTVVRQPNYEIGRQAALMLMQLLSGQHLEQQRIVFQPELVVRRSCKVGGHSH